MIVSQISLPSSKLSLVRAGRGVEMQRKHCPHTQIWFLLNGEWTETQGKKSRALSKADTAVYQPQQPCNRISESNYKALSITTSHSIRIQSQNLPNVLPALLNIAHELHQPNADCFKLEELELKLLTKSHEFEIEINSYLKKTKEILIDSPSPLTLKELAYLVGISPNHLSFAFKNKFGITLSKFNRLVQLQRSIKGHWTDANFFDQSHFNKVCKQELSLNPCQIAELLKS